MLKKDLKKSEVELLEAIESDDPIIVSNAVQRIRQQGNCRILPEILNILSRTEDSNVEAKIVEILFDLKDQNCAAILIEKIREPKLKNYHHFLIASFWQSSLDGSEYLKDFVDAAIRGDYMSCLECLTVVENFDSSFEEEDIIECNADLQEAIEEEENQDKKTLLIHLQEVINNLAVETD